MRPSIHADNETNHFIKLKYVPFCIGKKKILPVQFFDPEGSFQVLTIAQPQLDLSCSFHTFHMSGRISKCAEHSAE